MEKSSNLLSEVYSLNDFNARYEYEFDYLISDNLCMVNCGYEIKGKTIVFKYDLNCLKNINDLSYELVLKLLINLIQFKKYYQSYLVEINLENLFVDINQIPKFLKRDILYQKKSYVKEILILAFYLIDKKRSFNDYEVSGFFIKYKSDLLNKLKKLEDEEEIFNLLWKEYEVFF